MNLKHIFFAIIILLLFRYADAQNVKPVFKKLILSQYEIDTTADGIKVNIVSLKQIDSTGVIDYQGDCGNGISDTVFRLDDARINSLNKIFKSGKPLTSFM